MQLCGSRRRGRWGLSIPGRNARGDRWVGDPKITGNLQPWSDAASSRLPRLHAALNGIQVVPSRLCNRRETGVRRRYVRGQITGAYCNTVLVPTRLAVAPRGVGPHQHCPVTIRFMPRVLRIVTGHRASGSTRSSRTHHADSPSMWAWRARFWCADGRYYVPDAA